MSETKFAFILTGGSKHPIPESLMFEDKANQTKVCGVADIESACIVAKELVEDGYNLIELCGDFGFDGAQRIKDAVADKAKVGYVIY